MRVCLVMFLCESADGIRDHTYSRELGVVYKRQRGTLWPDLIKRHFRWTGSRDTLAAPGQKTLWRHRIKKHFGGTGSRNTVAAPDQKPLRRHRINKHFDASGSKNTLAAQDQQALALRHI